MWISGELFEQKRFSLKRSVLKPQFQNPKNVDGFYIHDSAKNRLNMLSHQLLRRGEGEGIIRGTNKTLEWKIKMMWTFN